VFRHNANPANPAERKLSITYAFDASQDGVIWSDIFTVPREGTRQLVMRALWLKTDKEGDLVIPNDHMIITKAGFLTTGGKLLQIGRLNYMGSVTLVSWTDAIPSVFHFSIHSFI
jgi:hypothetical protein